MGGHVVIDIADDGGGIDPERIRRKAVERGLISSDRIIHEEALLPLIFEPGFSTAESITDLSGRGVGMDVVKRRVEALGGTVAIDSRKGVGTTISLKLPMTMAIIDGLLIRIDGTRYLIPLTDLSECVDLRGKELVRARSRGAMALRGRLVPYICLTQCLAPGADLPGDEYGVVVRRDDGLAGLGVERVIGFHQAVIKPLGKAYQEAKLFSGSTILGDGQVALILDVQSLIATWENRS
jgi:two-component system chemotaxis sensor kinase CheA